MANSSTPRLKVYRLNENYVQSGDNDVQPMTNDEMLPIVPKYISPFNAEPMVGVRTRQDGRIVVESNEWNVVALEVEMMPGTYVQTKTPICCEGWVLGKGNMEVCVYKGKGTALTPPSGIEVNNGDFSDYPDGTDNTSQWIPIDRKFWDYSVESKKTYCVPSDGSEPGAPSAPRTDSGLATYFSEFSSDVAYGDDGIGGALSALYKNGWYSRLQLAKPSNDVNYEVHDMDWITFTIGKMLFKGDRFFKNGYENGYVPVALAKGSDSGSPSGIVVSGRILVRYKKYCEVGTGGFGSGSKFNGVKTDAFSGIDKSKCRVPFGDIYNGNKNGRALGVVGSTSRVNLVEEGTEAVDSGKQSFYEGNYLYRRKIYPLRVKVIQASGVSSEFSSNVDMVGMRAEVPCELSWFMDDVMKPVVFERITVDEGTPDARKIFKQLTKKQVTVAYQNSNDNDVYIVTLNSVYYETASRSPRELFLVYNYVDDSLGDIFDFDYDYIRTTTNPNVPCFMNKSAKVGYGYANDGRLATDDYDHDSSLTVSGIDGNVYLKRTVLAVRKDSGSYDITRDIPIDNPNGSTSISFKLSNELLSSDESDSISVQNEKKRINDGLSAICVDANHILNVYVDGTRLCSIDGVTTSSTSTFNYGLTTSVDGNVQTVTHVNIGGDNGYSVSYDKISRTMTIAHPDPNKVAELVEVMVSYYEQHPISFRQSGNANPYCIGYRVPCHEKVKNATLFVSSFPNWVKGHVNNDLDVFVGNKLYSGTELKGGNLAEYHNIYPQYVKDGWYAMYHDGAVEFNEPQEEINYFDMLNYGGEITNDISNTSNEGSSTDGWNYLSSSIWRTPDYWANAKKLSLAVRKVKYNVAHYDGIYSVIRGRMCNYSNKGEMYRYALLEDDDNYGSRNKRLVGRSDSSIRRMMESGRDEMPKLISNVSTADFPMDELHDIKFDAGNRYALVNTKNDRVTTFAIPSDVDYVVMCFGAEPTDAGLVSEEVVSLHPNWVMVYAKVQDGKLFFSTDNISWSSDNECADIPDVITGTLSDNGDNYSLDKDISEIQESMKVFSPKDATSGSSWTYDVCFEPFSYRRNSDDTVTYVEVVAYRKMKI